MAPPPAAASGGAGRRADLERRPGPGPDPPRHPAPGVALRRHDASALPEPGPRIRVSAGPVRARLPGSAAPSQGGRAERRSVLAGAGPEQAADRRLAGRHLSPHRHDLPPRPPRRGDQQLRAVDPDRRRGRGSRRRPPALARRPRRIRLRPRRHPHPAPPAGPDPGARGAGAAPPLRPVAGHRDALPRARHRGSGPLPVQLHPGGQSRQGARGHQRDAGAIALRGALVAPLPPGARDPAARLDLRVSDADDHPRQMGHRRLRFLGAASRRLAGRPPVRRARRAGARFGSLDDAAPRRGGRRPAVRPPGLRRAQGPRRAAGFPPGAGGDAAEPARHDRRERCGAGEPGAGARARPGRRGPGERRARPAPDAGARVSRVQGLALGLGGGLRLNGGYDLRGTLGYGLSDRRITVALAGTVTRGATEWTFDSRRAIRDFGAEPVVSGIDNSLLAQEAGKDLGDYILAEEIGVGLRRHLDPRWTLELAARGERSSSVATAASPVRNEYRANPALGSGSYWLGRTVISLAPRGALDRADLKLRLALEGGAAAIGGSSYVRASFRSDGSVPIPVGHLRLRTIAGWGSRELPKARGFVIGGRGTLPAEGRPDVGA